MNGIEEIIKVVERLICHKTGKSLSFIQKVILQESLNETQKTYAQIAQENNYLDICRVRYDDSKAAPKPLRMLCPPGTLSRTRSVNANKNQLGFRYKHH